VDEAAFVEEEGAAVEVLEWEGAEAA